MSEPLPELLDAKALRAELGVTRAAAEAIMRRLPVVQIEGLRKTYVRRDGRPPLPRGADFREGSGADREPGAGAGGFRDKLLRRPGRRVA